jgi:site-specific recombinase XerD
MIALPPLFSSHLGHFTQFFETFASKRTGRAYLATARDFSDWCAQNDIHDLEQVVAQTLRGFLAACAARYAPATTKQRAICLRRLLESTRDFRCPAGEAFHGLKLPKSKPRPRHWSQIAEDDLQKLLHTTGAGIAELRDSALLAVLVTCFLPTRKLCRLSTKTFLRNKDGAWLRLGENWRGKKSPCPPNAARAIESYLTAGGMSRQVDPYLFRTIAGASGALTERPLSQTDVWRIVRKRARAVGIKDGISPRALRAAGIARFLTNGNGDLETAADLAGHSTTRSTIRYAPPGTKRPRNRIAYRLEELDEWQLFENG